MVSVAAPKKTLSADMRRSLLDALAARDEAEARLWDLCADAVQPEEGTYEQVAEVLGIAKSTLQNKVRDARRR